MIILPALHLALFHLANDCLVQTCAVKYKKQPIISRKIQKYIIN